MQEEITEITFVASKKERGSSFWINTLAVVALVGLVFGAREISIRFLNEGGSAAEDDQPNIVMEDLENEMPLAESDVVKIPVLEENKRGPGRFVKGVRQAAVLKTAKKKVEVKKPLRPKMVSEYAKPDPYTSGGEEDLDADPMRKTYRATNVIKVPAKEATASPPTPEAERDEFIPFELQ